MSFNPSREPGPQPEHVTDQSTDQPAGALLSDDQIRWLRRAVVAMTALLVAGVAVLIGRVIYLARPTGTQAASATVQAALLPEVRLALPARAALKAMTVNGSRVFVTHALPGGDDEITVVDLATGRVISHMAIERGK
jgi:Family of unknown function (DUF6476)